MKNQRLHRSSYPRTVLALLALLSGEVWAAGGGDAPRYAQDP